MVTGLNYNFSMCFFPMNLRLLFLRLASFSVGKQTRLANTNEYIPYIVYVFIANTMDTCFNHNSGFATCRPRFY